MTTELLTGFFLGFLGSFHCVVMCGPIALSLPAAGKSNLDFLLGRIVYNLGRITVYTFLGLLLGFLGERIFIAGFQQMLSVIIGMSIIVYLVFRFYFKRRQTNVIQITNKNRFVFIKNIIGKIYSNGSKRSLYVMGVLNGFLPCGFVYIALAGAMTSASVYKGSVFMIAFGIGTVPLMLALSITGKFIKINFRKKINRYSPVLAALLALIFVIRGLNIQIPYLHSKIELKSNTEVIICR